MSDFDALSRNELISLILDLRGRVLALEAELERLRKDPPSGVARAVPSFVKSNRPPREKKVRKKRANSYVRPQEAPTQIVEHALDRCPDCGRQLSGGWTQRVRQVIDIPFAPYSVTEHRMTGHYCGVCAKRRVASPDLSGVVVGRHRVGVRLMSLVGYLSEVCRMPKRTIQALLRSMYGLHLALGEITELLHVLAKKGRAFYESLREAVRGSPCVNADETGWREDGVNGYVWSFSNSDSRLYLRDQSRGHQVSLAALGEEFRGVLVSDFYGGYNYHLGEHQRCWAHFIRDLKDLLDKHPGEPKVCAWVKKVTTLYQKARDFKSENRRKRALARFRFQDRLVALGEICLGVDPYGQAVPQRVLAQRCVRYANELFTFVEHPQVPSENNAAERAIRPLVTARKVSGGTRSAKGSDTKMVLASLYGTWLIRNLDPLQECQRMLTAQSAI
jgi:transposase